jgi:hypothetical protein
MKQREAANRLPRRQQKIFGPGRKLSSGWGFLFLRPRIRSTIRQRTRVLEPKATT